jgi:DNA-binding NarL/FixJ family response regulator
MGFPVDPHVTGINPRVILEASSSYGVSFGFRFKNEDVLVEIRWAAFSSCSMLSIIMFHNRMFRRRNMAQRSRVLIADDHTFVAESLKILLETAFDIVGLVSDGHAMVQTAIDMKPDVIMVDVGMPLMNGLDAGRQVKEILPAVKLVYLTMNSDPDIAIEAFRRGASGYLVKTCAASELVTAIQEVLMGKKYLPPTLKDNADFLDWRQRKVVVDEGGRLTARQREVLQLLAEGNTMGKISVRLGMTIRTVAYHKYGMMRKLGLNNGAELVRYAIRNNIGAA